jgi:hypothetical protein
MTAVAPQITKNDNFVALTAETILAIILIIYYNELFKFDIYLF